MTPEHEELARREFESIVRAVRARFAAASPDGSYDDDFVTREVTDELYRRLGKSYHKQQHLIERLVRAVRNPDDMPLVPLPRTDGALVIPGEALPRHEWRPPRVAWDLMLSGRGSFVYLPEGVSERPVIAEKLGRLLTRKGIADVNAWEDLLAACGTNARLWIVDRSGERWEVLGVEFDYGSETGRLRIRHLGPMSREGERLVDVHKAYGFMLPVVVYKPLRRNAGEDRDRLLQAINEVCDPENDHLDCYGEDCALFAVALNRVLGGRDEDRVFLGSYDTAMEKKYGSSMYFHVALLHRGELFDGSGVTSRERLLGTVETERGGKARLRLTDGKDAIESTDASRFGSQLEDEIERIAGLLRARINPRRNAGDEDLRRLERAAMSEKTSPSAIKHYLRALSRLGESRGSLPCPWCFRSLATIYPAHDYADCKACGTGWSISGDVRAPSYPSAGQRIVEVDEPHRHGRLGRGKNRPRRGAAWVRVFFDGESPDGETVRVSGLRAESPLDKNPGGHFLDSVESAIAWALENVGDAEQNYPTGEEAREADRENGRGWSAAQRDMMEDAVAAYVSKFHEVTEDGEARIWRGITIPADADARDWIKWDCLGTYWSFVKRGAGDYGNAKDPRCEWPELPDGPTRVVVVEAIVPADGIDWEHGFTSFWCYGLDQFECSLKDGARIEVVSVDGVSLERAAVANPRRNNDAELRAFERKVLAGGTDDERRRLCAWWERVRKGKPKKQRKPHPQPHPVRDPNAEGGWSQVVKFEARDHLKTEWQENAESDAMDAGRLSEDILEALYDAAPDFGSEDSASENARFSDGIRRIVFIDPPRYGSYADLTGEEWWHYFLRIEGRVPADGDEDAS